MNTLAGFALRSVNWLYELLGFNLMHDAALVAVSVLVTLAVLAVIYSDRKSVV